MSCVVKKYKQRIKYLNENAVYLILSNSYYHEGELHGMFTDCCDTYEAATKVVFKDLISYVADNVDELKNEDIDETITTYLEDNVIIKKIGLDKNKPIYLKLCGNYFYWGITNDLDEWKSFYEHEQSESHLESCTRNFK